MARYLPTNTSFLGRAAASASLSSFVFSVDAPATVTPARSAKASR